nr:hypothetical protein [uncultured bacterium]
MKRWPCALVAALVLGLPPARARADDAPSTAQACVTAYETAQVQQRRGELTAARESLRFCARSACPAVASNDCMQWLGDVERAIPSVVIGAHAGARDVADVVVTIDGKEVARRLDGRALDLDPGSHTFVFTAAGRAPIERMLVIKAGEKNRTIDVQLEPPPPPDAPPERAAAPPGEPAQRDGEPRRIAAFVVGGVGLLGLATGAVFGVRAVVRNRDANRVCPGTDCADPAALDANRDARTSASIANVGIAVGLAGVGVAAYLFATTPARVHVAPYAGRDRGGLFLSGSW